ncbi:MAG: tripartite tricarboxylate transporter substrate binding protein [Burkholderiales bacterium]|nr:tripartite tricarboxylate transporter substrate binding protein [Burkholderiales bacterium]
MSTRGFGIATASQERAWPPLAVVLAVCAPTAHALAASEAIVARAYPVKPIHFIVAAPPGGPADALTRMIAPKLTEIWNQPVVIDNRPGANGIIGTEMTARAAPDGYTIVMVAAGVAINPSLYRRVPYDPVRDFSPVTQAIALPNVLVVHPSLGVAGIAELVAAARAKPDTIAFGSAGKGTSGHLALELLQLVSTTRFVHLASKGGSQALSELLGAKVHALFSIGSSALPHVRAGRLSALAVTSPSRSRAAPELPTVAESGYPGFEACGWFGVLAPASTPSAIVAKLNAEIARILHSPEVEQRLLAQAADPVASEPAAFARHIARETRKWKQIIKQAGIKPD